jgi:hypothetical protein
MRRKNLQLHDDNKKLERTLAKEIGEGRDVELAQSEGWRGRSQQIVMLKSKVKRLEAMLGGGSGGSSSSIIGDSLAMSQVRGGATIASEALTYASTNSRRSNDVDSKAAEDLAFMHNSRQQVSYSA